MYLLYIYIYIKYSGRENNKQIGPPLELSSHTCLDLWVSRCFVTLTKTILVPILFTFFLLFYLNALN